MTASVARLVHDDSEVAAAYAAHLEATGRGNVSYERAARRFFERWPDPRAWAHEPLATRLAADKHTRPLLTFLMLHGGLRPGYDYLVARKLTALWRELPGSRYAEDLERFVAATVELGYAPPVARGVGSQVVARLLVQTGRPLHELRAADLDELRDALVQRERRDRVGWPHYRISLHAASTVLFHLGVLVTPPPNPHEALRQSWQRRLRDAPDALRPRLVAYLERLTATHARGTVSGIATRLGHFARHLAAVDPDLVCLADLDRQRHVETYLTAVAAAARPVDGLPISVSERRARVITVNRFLADITEWDWPDAPARQLLFPRDVLRLPRPLPRYLPADVDRKLVAALHASPNRQRALALLLQRACGLRVGELVDLELDCVHEVDGQGLWLKVPLSKLATERMVPIDNDTVALIDELVVLRSPGRALPHPRHGRPVAFLLTHHGGRVSTSTLQKELRATALAAGLEPVTPHQLRHTYATAMVNAGVSLQTLMVLLGHVSANMSLRYGRLFDATVRADYERALAQAKAHLGGPVLPAAEANRLPLVGDWKDAPAIKARMAGGYCIRTPAQGSCAYANICEHCPNYRSDSTFLPILATQKADAAALAADAQARGWIDEADRHLQLVERLDALISHTRAS